MVRVRVGMPVCKGTNCIVVWGMIKFGMNCTHEEVDVTLRYGQLAFCIARYIQSILENSVQSTIAMPKQNQIAKISKAISTYEEAHLQNTTTTV